METQQQLSCPCSKLGSLCHRSGCLSRGYFYSEFSSCHRRNLAGKPHGTFETSTQAASACSGGQVPVNQSTRRAMAGHLCALHTVRHKRTLTHVTPCATYKVDNTSCGGEVGVPPGCSQLPEDPPPLLFLLPPLLFERVLPT